jgi:hypothetical protein
MIEPKNRELQAVRIEVAMNLCITYPTIYDMIKTHKFVFKSDKERVACELLMYMMRYEPCIKNILSFYYKRM